LGDKEFLLTGQDGVNMPQLIKENCECLAKVFEFIKPWGEGVQVGNKVV